MKNTLDLDLIDKETLHRIIEKINVCPAVFIFDIIDTMKGYHVIMYCSETCDNCRLVFDDQKRYGYDLNKPNCFKNVLFEPFYISRIGKKSLTESPVKPGEGNSNSLEPQSP